MPNVKLMADRMSSMMARVSEKKLSKEYDRITDLYRSDKISYETARFMRQSAPVRLTYLANAG